MQYLRADTNTEVLIGPAVAVGDGFTPVTTLSLSTADEAEIIKYGGATPLTVTSISANGFAAITGADGYYTLDITTGNSDTEGFLTVLINDDSLILPIRVDFMVVNANVYDSLFAAATTDYLQTDAIQFAGTAYATALAAEVDAVWDEPISGHLTAGTAGLYAAISGGVLVDSTITGTPTSTTFDFTGGSTSNDFYNDQLFWIISGTGIGQVRTILSSSYAAGTTTITVDEAFIITPASGDRFTIQSTHVHPLSQVADSVWDEVLSKSTHNVAQSAGKRLRGIDDAFEVHAGTAQTGAAGSITLDTGASATDNIYRGDRIVIVAGTGAQEHGICTAYNGTTKVATMAENWVVTPDATSEFEIVPADVDVETWNHTVASVGATSSLPVVDAQAISDSTAAADNTEAVAADWLDGGRLDLIQDELTTQGDTNETLLNDIPTVAEFEARTPTAAQLAYIVANAATGLPVTFTTSGGSTTAAVLNQVDSAAASSTNDQYNGRLLVFTDGTLKGVVTDITDYDGATTTATITAIPTAPTSTHNARLI